MPNYPNDQGLDGGAIPVRVTTGGSGPTPVPAIASSALESSHVFKAAPGSLLALTVIIGASAGYVMLFDALTPPADGAVTPAWCFPVSTDGAQGAIASQWPVPLKFITGIVAVFSTTGPFTKTASSTAAFSGQVN